MLKTSIFLLFARFHYVVKYSANRRTRHLIQS